jgi:uncharacterized protein (TIGR02145 family)
MAMKTNHIKMSFIILGTAIGMMSCSKTDYHNDEQSPESSKSVSTFAPEKVTMTTAYIKGSVETANGGNITEKGIYLVESQDQLIPDLSMLSMISAKKFTGTSEGDADFFVSLTNLKADTRYGYVAFATNSTGTIYGEMKALVTSYGTVNDINGNQYQTVRIGDQIWMRENLKSENYTDQSPITGHYDLESDNIYGKHYSWNASNRVSPGAKSGIAEGVCPTGWHIPSDGEWQQLLSYVGVPENQLNSLDLIGNVEARRLKDAGSDHWTNDKVNNVTGFSALAGGIVRDCDEEWPAQGAFWTSTPNIFYGFQNESEKICRGNHPGCNCGLSVRCVQD